MTDQTVRPEIQGKIEHLPATSSETNAFRDDPEVQKLLEEMVLDNRTQMLCLRLIEKGCFAPPDRQSPHGYYLNRRIIGRDSTINGGVYLGGGEREAIIVDDAIDDGVLSEIFFSLITQILKTAGKRLTRISDPTRSMLTEIYNLVSTTLPYSSTIVERVGKGKEDDKQINLAEYIKAGGGVCRHQALLTAYLIEKLLEKTLIKGKVSVDRNYVTIAGGAHAWVRFETADGQVIIVDPAQRYVGSIEESPATGWFYEGVKRLAPEKQFSLDLMESGEIKPLWVREKMLPKVLINGPLSSEEDNLVELNGAMAFNIRDERLQIFVCGRQDAANTINLWREKDGTLKISYWEKNQPIVKSVKDLVNEKGEIGVAQSDRRDQLIITTHSPFNFCTILVQENLVTVTDHGQRNKTSVRIAKEEMVGTQAISAPLFPLVPGKPVVIVYGNCSSDLEKDWQKIEQHYYLEIPEDRYLWLLIGDQELLIAKDGEGKYQIFLDRTTSRDAREYMSTPDAILIGRSEQNDLVLSNPCVSAVHCRLHFQGNGIKITDFGSSNGTSCRLVKDPFNKK